MIKKLVIILFFLGFAHQAHATFYYVDFSTTTAGGVGTATSTAFANLNQFTNVARTAGDVAFVRRGTASTTSVTAATFTSDGTLNSPITAQADYDNFWGDFASSTVTWTPTFGSTFISSSASSTDFLTPNKWIYLQSDCYEHWGTATSTNPCEFAYEVASTSPAGLDLYLPYKGNQSGAGINMRVMPSNPQIGTASEANQVFTLSTDDYWYFKGLDLRGTNTSCTTSTTGNKSTQFFDMIFQGDGVTDCGFQGSSGVGHFMIKTRFFGFVNGVVSTNDLTINDFWVDCNNVASSHFIRLGSGYGSLNIKNGIVKNCTQELTTNGVSPSLVYSTNVTSPVVVSSITGNSKINFFFEDKFGTVGLNSQTSNQISADAVATTTMATTTNLRSGGGSKNLVVFPPSGTSATGISTQYFPFSYIKLFEYPIYADTSSKTYTMYFNSTSTSNFIRDPFTTAQLGSTTPEIYIECEYYNDATDADRMLKRSSGGAMDFNGSTAWQSLSVTCQPTQTGILYLRGWYAMPKDTTASNWFYMDTQPQIQ